MALNKAQAIAVAHKDGPMMVLAGPGSGKTLVITRRIKYLIEYWGVAPSEIMVITFTRAAAYEMRQRFVSLMGGIKLPVTFGTFHAIFFQILKHAYGLNGSHILKEDEKYNLLSRLVEKQELDIEDMNEFIASLSQEISLIKNDRILLEHYYSSNCPDEVFRFIYQGYQKHLEQRNLLDFDDMLTECYKLLHEREDICKAYQSKYRYFLIDEFQDTNMVQYDTLKLLAEGSRNLFIVGDDDQSIYRFRGARPEIMLNFPREYPDAKQILLDKNYRSDENVLRCALRVIGYNKQRFAKVIEAVNPSLNPVELKLFKDQQEENEWIVTQIRQYIESGGQYEDAAVLYRTNTGPRRLAEKFMEYNLPFVMRDMIPNIYDHWICSNILAYLRASEGPISRSDFLQIMNRPNRYISRDSIISAQISLSGLKQYYCEQTKNWMVERLEKLEQDLHLLKGMHPYAAIHFIRYGIGYEDYLKSYADFRKMKAEDLLEILDIIQEGAKEFKTREEWLGHIADYSEKLKKQKKDSEQQKGVTFSTLHSSKGLEYKKVYIIDANEEIMPHKKAVLDADIEEERRLFYVGMTRARESLTILSAKSIYGKEQEVSRFVNELRIDTGSLVPGARILHVRYGKGIIHSMHSGKAVIRFSDLNREIKVDIEHCIQNRLILQEGTGFTHS